MTFPMFLYGTQINLHLKQSEKLQPQPLKPVKSIATDDWMITTAENAYKRRMLALGAEITLMNGRKGTIESLKPAKGELLRNPTKFIAVLWDDEAKRQEEIELVRWAPVKVIQ